MVTGLGFGAVTLFLGVRPTLSAADIRNRFPEDWYVAYHAHRYALALRCLSAAGVGEPAGGGREGAGVGVLDVGRSPLTTLLAETFRVRVDTLGFEEDAATEAGRHFRFDLNRAQERGDWRSDLPIYGAIVLAEVLEHLHTAPSRVLAMLRDRLAPGGVLLLQTPNAAAMHKRLLLLTGRHPYDRIAVNPLWPTHFREYTAKELAEDAASAGFVVERCIRTTYFDYGYRGGPRGHRPTPGSRWVNHVYRVLPPSLQRGITMVLRPKPGGD